jgi:DNA repair exonuclease SbcCD ATPase subunit
MDALQNDNLLKGYDQNIRDLNAKIIGFKKQLASLEGMDKSCQSTSCQFIVSARKAEEELVEAEKQLKELTAKTEERRNFLNGESTKIDTQTGEKENALKDYTNQIASTIATKETNRKVIADERRELTNYQELAAKLPEIAVAKSKKEDREKDLEENKKDGLALSEAWTARNKTLSDQINSQQEKIDAVKLDPEPDMKALEREIATVQSSITGIEKTISETNQKIAELQGKLSGMDEAENQLKAAQASKEKTNADIAEWTYIKNACGKNGLQAMEIDGAAPLITAYANDLLSNAFGALYSVKLLTQDEEGKECLDIISIGEDGEEILLDNLSGGQKVWLLMALRLAMTLLSKDKGGKNFETAFFDEMDGALDPDNAINFINLYKSFMDIGKFTTIPYISHKPECRSMADHVLMFEAGKNPYWI